jgi:archaellum component FlaG (FlaF/FlaG flagellin family)
MIAKKRRGISTFIATLLLMVLAVAAGVVIYAYTMGYLGSFNTPSQMGAISIDTYSLDPTVPAGSNALIVYIRNIGKSSFQLNTIYIGGKLLTTGYNMVYDPNDQTVKSLTEGKVGTLTISMGASGNPPAVNYFEASKTYDIKIIGVDNTQLSFQVKK